MGVLETYSQTIRALQLLLFLAVLGMGGYFGVELMRARLEADLYRDRVEALVVEYEDLRGQYNRAVEQAAVTELRVEDGRLAVVVRTNEALFETIETPYDPQNEIHVDFVVKRGRLLIRRVYDGATAPQDGLLIDPELESVRWKEGAVSRGLAVYRGGLENGRWVVTTTGNGALDLSRIEEGMDVKLHTAPEIRSFDEIHRQVGDAAEAATTVDLLSGWISRATEP